MACVVVSVRANLTSALARAVGDCALVVVVTVREPDDPAHAVNAIAVKSPLDTLQSLAFVVDDGTPLVVSAR